MRLLLAAVLVSLFAPIATAAERTPVERGKKADVGNACKKKGRWADDDD